MNPILVWSIVLVLAIYIIGVVFWYLSTSNRLTEGMTSNTTSSSSGVAANNPPYLSSLKIQSGKRQDTLLVSKYQSDYENTVIALDDLLDNLLLQKALTIDPTNPQSGFIELGQLHQAKAALDSVMAFIDKP